MLYILQHRFFPIKQSSGDFTFYIRSPDFLNRDMIVITEIYSSKYLAEAAFSNFFVQINGIIVYLFDERDCSLLMDDHVCWKNSLLLNFNNSDIMSQNQIIITLSPFTIQIIFYPVIYFTIFFHFYYYPTYHPFGSLSKSYRTIYFIHYSYRGYIFIF